MERVTGTSPCVLRWGSPGVSATDSRGCQRVGGHRGGRCHSLGRHCEFQGTYWMTCYKTPGFEKINGAWQLRGSHHALRRSCRPCSRVHQDDAGYAETPDRTLISLFELDGFSTRRTRGDHVMMTKPGIRRPVLIKTSPRAVAVTHILTNMRTAGMNRETYFRLLDDIT